MTAEERAAIAAVRERRPLHRLSADTRFVDRVLAWVLEERRSGRLDKGDPISFVQSDFGPGAAQLGTKVDLRNGGAVQGGLHLCSELLRQAYVNATGLLTLAAHQDKLAHKQFDRLTSVCFDPVTGAVQIRLACMPMQDPIEFTLAAQLDPAWAANALDELGHSVSAFHSQYLPMSGAERLLLGARGPRREMRVHYRDALYIHLTYQLGLVIGRSFRVTTRAEDVKITHVQTERAALVTATGTGSTNSRSAQAMIDALIARAHDAFAEAQTPTHITCIACPLSQPPGQECAEPPVSLRHRHLSAA